ncbi:hypothetical protein PSEUBRA_001135 [Kalmanozyma brasiliensis GHG001]|uniref:uncharacterized protein n=1 Tax=Kalmanozyma brasiliensis (strain GHG001) TaxID=1365824 RepID=UPI002867FF68|nr:uncharacterized protein PSEUBRA_001135 [Kalmanozyma brasiliensis GHG001]EST09184.2 hypothetical protein PSEUBRA_001135 [Kalmanozyma brasiliensis GHG001]
MLAPLASASLAFLVVYILLFFALCVLLTVRRAPQKLLWLLMLNHVLLRLAAQSTGLAFATRERDIRSLIAYSLLSAQGQYTLLLCFVHTLVAWQAEYWKPKVSRSPSRWASGGAEWTWLVVGFDLILILADMVIVAGAVLSGTTYSDPSRTPSQMRGRLATGKWLRTGGQSAFWLLTLALLVPVCITIHRHRRRRYDQSTERESDISLVSKGQPSHEVEKRPWFGHAVLGLLLLTWPFLVVRGIWGVLQAAVPDLNYFDSERYDADGFTGQFVVEEACMVTLMEFCAAVLLTAVLLVWRRGPRHRDDSSETTV